MDKQAENALASLEEAVVMKDNRTRYTVMSETKINDPGMDMAPAIANRRGNAIILVLHAQLKQVKEKTQLQVKVTLIFGKWKKKEVETGQHQSSLKLIV